jgi:hypothetical protein
MIPALVTPAVHGPADATHDLTLLSNAIRVIDFIREQEYIYPILIGRCSENRK